MVSAAKTAYTALVVGAVLALGAGPAVADDEIQGSEEGDRVNLIVTTRPRTADYPVYVDGREYRTDAGGRALIEVERGDHTLAVDEMVQVTDDTRIIFNRWHDTWDRQRIVTINRTKTLTLGLLVQHRMGFTFSDALGEHIPASDIESVVLMNSNGDRLTLSNTVDESPGSIEAAWLTANRLRRTGAGLLSDDSIYVFVEVNVGGKNVIQSGADKFTPEPGIDRPVDLLVFPLEVEVRSFVYSRPVSGELGLYNLDALVADEPIATVQVVNGLGMFPRLPRGDYEVVLLSGGTSPRSPVILTGPKVERITVFTSQLWWLVVPLLLLLIGSVVLFVVRPGSRIPLIVAWAVVGSIGLSTPSIGSALNRPLSAHAEAIYSSRGDFIGIRTEVVNRSPISIRQTYCRPDFELRVISDQGVWVATYESHDFHDVEFGECRVHKIAPGSSRNVFSPFEGQEWVVESGTAPPPGRYEAFVRIFGVPAQAITLNVGEGFLEGLVSPPTDESLFDEIPFTNPFED